MRVAALMPTRDRPATAVRAASSFLSAVAATGAATSVDLTIVDDSDAPEKRLMLDRITAELATTQIHASIRVERCERPPRNRSVARPGGGPGAARNFGLRLMRRSRAPGDALVLFDDDIVFGPISENGMEFDCDGPALLAEALEACRTPRTIIGCDYVGRQDLSFLEHAQLDHGSAPSVPIPPAIERGDVASVAPGGISTAFLAVAGTAADVPDFPEHYNEDYLWLHAMARAGWRLLRTREPLVHAPPGHVAVSARSLSFQILGEIVWLGVLETDRYPVGSYAAMAAAIEEIAGDLIAALARPSTVARPDVQAIVEEVLAHYQAISKTFRDGLPSEGAIRIQDAIRKGLGMHPPQA